MGLFFFPLLGLIALWISYQDIRYGRIPNLALIALGFLLCWHYGHIFQKDATLSALLPLLLSGLLGLSLVGVFLFLPKYRSFVGAGDLKLFCLACFFVPLETLPFFLITSGVLGGLWAVVYKKKTSPQKTFPLGPALMFALVGVVGFARVSSLSRL
ncbi:MAG: hypothetical protein A2621_04705 [Alphaproteobacteria bacterium RIFCSPHIGHO2_01_FULL_41_14]|nr:MAG: hypothetical protein A2065_00080 [Alphaproteobacteria bacterium GWB1_45_5]OFW76083.1 MAG: hypothetical protein A3K20_03035 [Alphaproteobacteria bacterium GWA1_45_9]OFW90261.1 MAG: hypothetical protein A2621_04705 [Alphaproteobacteria bacterium RIFCSPHIGHO2_01_FULL_41_14]HCI48277.1 hypothetical protein [Holosporales bacterium]